MQQSIGVEEARSRLGQLADEAEEAGEAIAITRHGRPIAVLIAPSEYSDLLESRRELARQRLQRQLAEIRARVSDAGLDAAVVDEAMASARALG
jgi:prevent-host-death family protein